MLKVFQMKTHSNAMSRQSPLTKSILAAAGTLFLLLKNFDSWTVHELDIPSSIATQNSLSSRFTSNFFKHVIILLQWGKGFFETAKKKPCTLVHNFCSFDNLSLNKNRHSQNAYQAYELRQLVILPGTRFKERVK